MSKARITYRFDHDGHYQQKGAEAGKEKGKIVPLFQEEFSVMEEGPKLASPSHSVFDTQSLNQYTTDFGAWSSPFDAETERLEKLIRETGNTNPGHKQAGDPAAEMETKHDPVTGYYDDLEQELPSVPYPRVHWVEDGIERQRFSRRSRTSSLKIISSAAGAVVTGVFFGYLVLSLFTGEPRIPGMDKADLLTNGSTPSVQGNQTLPAEEVSGTEQQNDSGSVGETDTKSPLNTAEISTAAIPSQTYYLLQNGVFGSMEGAEAAQVDLMKMGLAAAGETAEQYYVYAGITLDRSEALLLSHQLKEKELEVYIKAYELPAVERIKWNGEQERSIDAYFAQGRQMVKMISGLSLVHLQESTETPMDDPTMSALKKEHQSWTGLVQKIEKDAPKLVKQDLQTINNAIHTAVISMEEYNKNPASAHLWQAQSALMQYIIAEKQLLSKLAAD